MKTLKLFFLAFLATTFLASPKSLAQDKTDTSDFDKGMNTLMDEIFHRFDEKND